MKRTILFMTFFFLLTGISLFPLDAGTPESEWQDLNHTQSLIFTGANNMF